MQERIGTIEHLLTQSNNANSLSVMDTTTKITKLERLTQIMGNQIENITERLGQLQKSVQILVDIDNIEFSSNELSTDIGWEHGTELFDEMDIDEETNKNNDVNDNERQKHGHGDNNDLNENNDNEVNNDNDIHQNYGRTEILQNSDDEGSRFSSMTNTDNNQAMSAVAAQQSPAEITSQPKKPLGLPPRQPRIQNKLERLIPIETWNEIEKLRTARYYRGQNEDEDTDEEP